MALADSLVPEVGAFGDIKGLIDALNGILGTQGSTNTNSSTSLGGDASSTLQTFLATFLPQFQSDQFSPENASKAAETITQQIMDQFQKGDLPEIYNAQNASGGYNSTTAQLLANDKRASAVAKASDSAIKIQQNFANNRAAQIDQMLKLVLGLAAANKVTQTNQATTTGAASQAAKNAALAAMAAKALGAKDKGTGSSSIKSKPVQTPKPPAPANNNAPYSETGDEKLSNLTDFTLPDLSESDRATADNMIGQQLDQAYNDLGITGDLGANYGDQLTQEILNSVDSNGDTGSSGSDSFDPTSLSDQQINDLNSGNDIFGSIDSIFNDLGFDSSSFDPGSFDFTFDSGNDTGGNFSSDFSFEDPYAGA